MSMLNSSTMMERTPLVDPVRVHMDSLDMAGRMVEKHISADSTFPSLLELTQIGPENTPSVSGLTDYDYNMLNGTGTPAGLSSIKQLSTLNKVPLPPEVVENFQHMQCHCMMGLFTEINRAWLTIDSDIYIWTYEGGSDVAFFEGLGETIVSVGLVKPKTGVFHNFVHHLLILTTTVEIVILGVTFAYTKPGTLGHMEEMNLLPDPVFVIPTDGITVNTIASTEDGRVFLGGRDGSLLEIVYQAEGGWFGKRCKKVNHSKSSLSFLMPSFLNVTFADEDPISHIAVDNSRHILYSLSDKGTISVYDLGETGNTLFRVTSISQSTLVQTAVKICRTFDHGLFRPLKSISVIELNESVHFNLVAVTESGVRLYFTTSNVQCATVRPNTLQLMHVRLPPGFAGGNPPSQRPSKVHMAHYRQGSLLLVTSPVNDHDTMWCLSSDSYPFHPYLFEEQTALALDGVAWSMAEVKATHTAFPCVKYSEQLLTPLVVRQHYELPRKYIVLTAQGAVIFTKLRPVDLLRQILSDNHGPENEAVKTYFMVQKEAQACATSLIIACNESSQNIQLAEWATRAFFLYGGEPQLGHSVQVTAANQAVGSPSFAMSFNPNVNSTPYGVAQQSILSNTDHRAHIVHFSAKHNGLYLYLGRILRPIWNLRIAVSSVGENGVSFISSTASRDDCVLILSHLHALSAFLEKNTQFSVASGTGVQQRAMNATAQSNNLQEAQLEEKRSLDALKVFVNHTCEVLGLWRILCEHQFHVIADLLDREHRNQLLALVFRHLILTSQDLCSTLINSLINRYLNDNASVDSISAKLREICPNLYRNEDAACSKANEMLLGAKSTKNPEERKEKLQSALQMCKNVAPQINLPVMCQWFASSQFYEGVLDLSVTCASRLDPKNAALHYYKNGEPAGDVQGYQSYARRVECYKEVTNCLDQLFGQSQSSPYAPTIPTSPGTPSVRDNSTVNTMDSEAQARRLLEMALDSQDELLHVALYDWMMSKQLYTNLIAITKPSLEMYLTKATKAGTNTHQIFDLLWKYYEKKQEHASAAKILYKLATEKSRGVSLAQRIEYLARAVMCMRSEKVGSAPHLGIFLRELEDLIEVARLQQKVLDGITRQQGRANVDEAVEKLNSSILDITMLYEDYAEPFGLWDCKLAIIHCSGHNDITLVENIWLNMIELEVRECTAIGPVDKMGVVLGKVKSLGREYALSPRCFPLAFLVRFLELQACRLQTDKTQVYAAMLDLNVSLGKLLDVYAKLIAANERCWADEGDDFHLVHVIVELVDTFTKNEQMVNAADRRATVAKATDALLSSLTALYSKPGTSEIITKVRGLQSRLDRMNNGV